ncbi:MAG: hypothetical protein AAF619_13710 [Pseudomonadota bacterium]
MTNLTGYVIEIMESQGPVEKRRLLNQHVVYATVAEEARQKAADLWNIADTSRIICVGTVG